MLVVAGEPTGMNSCALPLPRGNRKPQIPGNLAWNKHALVTLLTRSKHGLNVKRCAHGRSVASDEGLQNLYSPVRSRPAPPMHKTTIERRVAWVSKLP